MHTPAVPRRADGIVTERSGDELYAFDPTSSKIHALNWSATQVLGLCDGERTVDKIAQELANQLITPDLVQLGLAELQDAGLIVVDTAADAPSRRDLLLRLGAGAAAVAAIPVVESIMAPQAAAASSTPAPTPTPAPAPPPRPTSTPLPGPTTVTFPGGVANPTQQMPISVDGVTLSPVTNGNEFRVQVTGPGGTWTFAGPSVNVDMLTSRPDGVRFGVGTGSTVPGSSTTTTVVSTSSVSTFPFTHVFLHGDITVNRS